MNKNFVVKVLRKKTHHFLTISVVILVISLSMLNYMVSYISNQYYTINRDFLTNNNVKVIHVNGKEEGDSTSTVQLNDKDIINQLIKENGLLERAKAYPIFILPTVFNSSMESGYSLIGLNKELAFLISEGCTLKDNSICVGDTNDESIKLNVPIIEEKDGGFSSSKTVNIDILAEKGAKKENAILIHSIPNNNQAYVNEDQALKLTEIMYQNSQNSLEYIKETQLDKVIVYVKDIKDVDKVGELLKEHKYYTSYTFNSFENFSANINTSQYILIILSVFLVITSIITAVLLMVNFLRIQRKEIAILKLNGYKSKSIESIYTRLFLIMFRNIFIYALLIYLLNYIFKLVPVSFIYLSLIVSLDLVILILTITFVYFIGIKKICNMGMIDLLKKGKEFE
ncbi:hypothetical protein ACFPRB_25190 [Metabacillus niabensis]|uniref:ABC transporter permease n=2 Tax=Metabacillus niabensis TaxID=324854 RepID=A0ABT9Z3E4_9BACI|nr:hypothetical protein [Metabacillus niabensis]MDQ0226530.1 hypothetical protein [Metabacillus niabensis]